MPENIGNEVRQPQVEGIGNGPFSAIVGLGGTGKLEFVGAEIRACHRVPQPMATISPHGDDPVVSIATALSGPKNRYFYSNSTYRRREASIYQRNPRAGQKMERSHEVPPGIVHRMSPSPIRAHFWGLQNRQRVREICIFSRKSHPGGTPN